MDLVLTITFLECFLYVICLVKSWYHVILLLIVLEFFSIKRFIICRLLVSVKIRALFIFFFSVIIVCEARIGIGLIVRLTRGCGDEAIEI
jgi:hypothetical protein